MLKVSFILAISAIYFMSPILGESDSRDDRKNSQSGDLTTGGIQKAWNTKKNPSHETDVDDNSGIPMRPCPASCLLRKNVGPCFGHEPRWYFNTTSYKCEPFVYGGCRGNANRFKSKKSCMAKCRRCRERDVQSLSSGTSQGSESMEPTCDCKTRRIGRHHGCFISVAPPRNFKCHCKYHPMLWRCSGTAIHCKLGETCPSHCFSKECCLRGKGIDGNCDGYPSKPLPRNLK